MHGLGFQVQGVGFIGFRGVGDLPVSALDVLSGLGVSFFFFFGGGGGGKGGGLGRLITLNPKPYSINPEP